MLTTRRVRPDDEVPCVSRGEAPQPEPRDKYLRGVTRVKRVEQTCRAGPVYQFVQAENTARTCPITRKRGPESLMEVRGLRKSGCLQKSLARR